jgi:hypothetical protein
VASIVVAYGGGWMSAELDGARVDGFQPKVVAATDDRSGEIDLRVVPAGRLEGAVFDADGHAVAGATVSLSQSDRWRGHCGNCYSRRPILPYLPDPDPVVTVADGRFVFDTVKPGLLYEVRASHEQLSADDEVTLDDPGTTRITLTLPRLGDERSPSPVDVVVKDEDGRAPIVGADVELISEGAPSRHASTGADGIARFDGVPGVGGAASVRAEGHVWGYSGSLSRAPLAGESRRSLAVALARTYDVRGRVVDPDGRPIPVANVSLWQRGGATQHEAAWTADGNFVFHDIAAGEFTLSSTLRRDGRDFVAEQKGAAGADGAEIVVRLTERAPPTVAAPATKSPATMAPEDVTIRVVGPDGVLASTGLYTSRTPETLREYEFHLRFRAGSFTTDPRVWGWEVVDVFDARSAVGERLAPGSSRALSAADLGTTVEVRLERAVSIGGRVVGSAGDPVAGARVAAHVPSKKRHDGPRAALATATTDARGAFTLEGLGREAYELEVDVPPAYLTPPATAVTAPAEGTIIALRPAIRPTITIVDEAGAPVANATVVVGRPGTIRWVSSSDRTLAPVLAGA